VTVSIQKFWIIVLVSSGIEYWSNYSIWFEISNIRTALLILFCESIPQWNRGIPLTLTDSASILVHSLEFRHSLSLVYFQSTSTSTCTWSITYRYCVLYKFTTFLFTYLLLPIHGISLAQWSAKSNWRAISSPRVPSIRAVAAHQFWQ